MKIKVKLFALLGKHLPPGSTDNEAEVEVPDGATPSVVMDLLNLPFENGHLVLVNGVHVEAEERRTLTLDEGDALAIWPPVAGG